jgi:hypothetical protein
MMLSCGSILAFVSWDKIFCSDVIFVAKFFIVLLYFITLGTIIFLILKLRILIVTKNKLTSLFLFRLQKTTIRLDEIKISKWTTFDIKAHKFISLTITDKSQNKVSISDFEFENFESIAASILGDKYLEKSIFYFKEQSRQNKFFTYFIAIISTALLVICIDKLNINKGFNASHAIFIFIILTILAAIKRIKQYRRIEKYGI